MGYPGSYSLTRDLRGQGSEIAAELWELVSRGSTRCLPIFFLLQLRRRPTFH